MGGIAAFAAPIAGSLIGSALGGSSAPSAPNVNVYQPGGTATADSQLQNFLTQNYNSTYGANNPYAQYAPQFNNLYSQIYSSPYQGGAQTAANTAGASYGQVGTQGVGASGALNSAALGLLPYGQQVMNSAFDPQSALYSQLLQRTTDTANVNNAQYGLTGQQAAANTTQADTNFNIDWQSQQLQRQLAGLSGVGTAVSQAGQTGTAAQNIGSAAAGSQVQAGSVPYEQQVAGVGNQNTALEQYIASLFGPSTSSQQIMGDLGSYLGQGISASEAGQQAAFNAYNQQLQGASLGGIGGNFIGSQLAGGFNFLNPSTTAQSSYSWAPWQQPGYVNP